MITKIEPIYVEVPFFPRSAVLPFTAKHCRSSFAPLPWHLPQATRAAILDQPACLRYARNLIHPTHPTPNGGNSPVKRKLHENYNLVPMKYSGKEVREPTRNEKPSRKRWKHLGTLNLTANILPNAHTCKIILQPSRTKVVFASHQGRIQSLPCATANRRLHGQSRPPKEKHCCIQIHRPDALPAGCAFV